ncbi:hypothetical protein LOC54_11905, partial [Acetobacter sp. AN02]|uniref:hypothetical protein n=1 Tax=Acetobacter sp. AN02 TaxID=2894186 RepID=UPI00243436BA
GKRFELIAKPAQPGKPLFNVKETRLFHDPYPNQLGRNGITKEASKPENFSNPPPASTCDPGIRKSC